ncbi:hypothetical protein PG990_009064 [Apiospora arundinis]
MPGHAPRGGLAEGWAPGQTAVHFQRAELDDEVRLEEVQGLGGIWIVGGFGADGHHGGEDVVREALLGHLFPYVRDETGLGFAQQLDVLSMVLSAGHEDFGQARQCRVHQ